MSVPTSLWDILEPSSNEQARAAYLERQMQNMGRVQISSSITPLEDDITLENDNLSRRIQDYCLRIKDHRRYEKDIHQVPLSSIKKYKEKQQQQKSQKERDEICAKISTEPRKVREIVGGALSRASTISVEEHQMALMETDFITIKEKMNKMIKG